MVKWIIYKTTCLINNKIYVGQHKTENINDGYLGSGKLINRSILKHGLDNFTREILCECNTREEASKNEEFWIQKLNSTDSSVGYNITKYAWGGQPHTKETKEKLRLARLGAKVSKETKLKMSKPKTEAAKLNMSKAQKNCIKKKGLKWYYNPISLESKQHKENYQPENWIPGRPKEHFINVHTEESNKKRGRKDFTHTIQTKEKIRKKLLGHSLSLEAKSKISESMRKYHEKNGNNKTSR